MMIVISTDIDNHDLSSLSINLSMFSFD